MSSDGALLSILDGVAAARGSDAPIVLVDGPSGAGKSTLADWLAGSLPGESAPVLVHMDDIYPGWQGLDEASLHIHDELLEPRRHGHSARWQRYDWATGLRAEWHEVPAGAALIVEGCGTLSRANAALGDVRIWLDAAPGIRKSRALARDQGGFDQHWDAWQESFDRFVAREHPASHADIVLDATNWPPSLREHSARAGLTLWHD